jgi:hypothetical protein
LAGRLCLKAAVVVAVHKQQAALAVKALAVQVVQA